MTSSDIRKKYIEFFKARGHKEIASAPLVPENDPTTLFTSAGMQPLIQYILGEPHPLGRRLVNSQKCFRSQDIEEVGDTSHTTFFEMLGNWSLGDPASADGVGAGYFKKEQLTWFFEFLTKELGLDPKQLYVSVFEGNESVPKDEESIEIWKELFKSVGIEAREGERIFLYPASKNWWSRTGEPKDMAVGEPGGPDSEVFYDFGKELKLHEHSEYKNEKCHPNCQCGRFMEIGNSVFMQYQKQADGSLKKLKQKSVDFGGGLERLNAAVNNKQDIFLTDSFDPMIRIIGSLAKKNYGENIEETKAMRVIADHIRGAVMMMADGVVPSNKTQGYVLRRLLRRSMLYGKTIGLWGNWRYLEDLVAPVVGMFNDIYPEVKKHQAIITESIIQETNKFGEAIIDAEKEVDEFIKRTKGDYDFHESRGEGYWKKNAISLALTGFDLYQRKGYPIDYFIDKIEKSDIFWDIAAFDQQDVIKQEFNKLIIQHFDTLRKQHSDQSRFSSIGMFKGGLADKGKETTKLHTATHLLHQALRMVLGNHVSQKGSNITAQRLRFDFSHPTKLTDEELKNAEALVNKIIEENLPVRFEEMDKDDVLKSGALGFFMEKYGDRVRVYTIGDPRGTYFSKEVCGGPHVRFTGELGHFTIIKEESAASGIRRIYAHLR